MAAQTCDQTISAVRATRRQSAWVWAVALGTCLAAYDLWLLSNGSWTLIAPEQLDRAFGSMLVHMLHGDFGVDGDAIGFESFTRNGHTFSYFGVVPALLRLPAMFFMDVTQGGLSRLSCLLAMLLFVGLQLCTLWLVHGTIPAARRSEACLAIMAVAICLSGPQLYLLGSATIYHEPVFWAAAMGAGYNLILLRAVLLRSTLTAADMVALAALAGLTLNTRASVGAALCLATGLLVLRQVWTQRGCGWQGRAAALLDRRVVWPVLVLAGLVAAAAFVNFERWGSPLRFADFRYYDFAHRQPWRLAMILHYGELNPLRIPVGALYYATGIPYLLKSTPPFADLIRTWFDGIEAPPFSGLLVNPLTIILAGAGLQRIIAAPHRLPPGGVAILRLALLGHAAAVILVCSAMYLAMRYRMDFAPFMTLAAFIGYAPAQQAALGSYRRPVLMAGIGLCALLAYWMGGAFLMGTKRYSEYRRIGDPRQAGLYRRSFQFYTEASLLLSSFFYALCSAFLIGVFLIKYKIELLLSFPFFAVLFTWYLAISLKSDSAAQAPEKLYRERRFMAFAALTFAVVVALFFINLPILDGLMHPYYVRLAR